jgi:adenylate kinase
MLLFGPPGVGKGTQAARLVARYKLCHVSTGDLLRSEVEKGSAVGRKVRSMMASGALVPDKLVIRLMTRRLASRACQRRGWLLDGFPRTAAQAHALVAAGLVPNHIVVLNASNETVAARALARAREAVARGEQPRKDDTLETVRRRFAEYERNRDLTLAALRSYLRVAHVDGGGSKEAVSGAIARSLDPAPTGQLLNASAS